MRFFSLALVVFSFLCVSCEEEITDSGDSSQDSALTSTGSDADSTVTITEIDTTSSQAQSQLDQYSASSFSKYIYFHKTEDKILLDYNFFPKGSDLCQQAAYDAESNPLGCKTDKTIVIPCDYKTRIEDDLLSVNISASTEISQCESDIVIDLSSAEFTTDGLVFSFTGSLNIFENDFEFRITKDGISYGGDGATLKFDGDDVGLGDAYEKIVEMRLGS